MSEWTLVRWATSGLVIGMGRTPAGASAPWAMHTIDNSYIGADGARPDPLHVNEASELAVVWEQSGVTTLHTPPSATMRACPWPGVVVGVTPNAEDAVAVDIDGDGDRDVVVCMEGTQRRVAVLQNSGDAGFREYTFDLPPFKWMTALPTDLDGDGRKDLVAAGRFVVQGEQGVMAWLSPGDDPAELDHWEVRVIADVGWPMSLLARDMDGDGDDDIVVADRYGASRGLKWVENPAMNADNAPWHVHFIGLKDRRVRSAAASDLDGDGDLDFVAAHERVNNIPPGLTLLTNTGAGWDPTPLELPEGVGEVKCVAVADFDLDGAADLALSCEAAYEPLIGVCVLLQRPSGSWELADVSGGAGCKFDLLTVVDLDGDGDPDLITTEEGDNGVYPALGVVWYENPGARAPGAAQWLLPQLPGGCSDVRPAWLEVLDDAF